MSHDEILSMEAGPALDWLIHTRVFGNGVVLVDGHNAEEVQRRINTPKPYSTDIAAAWQVFDHVCDGLFSRRQRFFRELQAQASREANFTPDAVAWPDVLVVLRKQFPLAVCRASLLAVVEGKA